MTFSVNMTCGKWNSIFVTHVFEQWGDIKTSHRWMTKPCLGNIGNLFVICMPQVINGHLYHLLGVSDYYVIYRHRAQ